MDRDLPFAPSGKVSPGKKRESSRILDRGVSLFFFAVRVRAWQRSLSNLDDWRVRIAIGLVLASTTGGCAHVAAYERGKLAHPTMAPGDADSAAREHVYAIQEGAMGGSVGAASGCGCN